MHILTKLAASLELLVCHRETNDTDQQSTLWKQDSDKYKKQRMWSVPWPKNAQAGLGIVFSLLS
jgi:hypothetical protein